MQRGSEPTRSEAKNEKAAVEEKKLELSNASFSELSTCISNIRETPDSYSLAVRIEMIFALQLLQTLILDAQRARTDLKEEATQILSFLQLRWDSLCNTAAWNAHSRHSRINTACWTTAKYFLTFFPDKLILRQIAKFETECEEQEKAILDGEAEAKRAGDDEIYKFIYRTIFAKQPINDAWRLLPKSMSEAGSEKEAWRILLTKIIPQVLNRQTFIRIVSRQVEREDWPYFFSRLTSHGHLFSLMLEVDINPLLTAHQTLPVVERTERNFEIAVFKAADNALRACTTNYVMRVIPVYGAEGSLFESHILEAHGCENQNEVLALAYSLLETYRRVRSGQDSHTSAWGKAASAVATVADKEVKVAGCDILMAFCLQAEQFSKTALEQYIAEKKRQGSLSQEKEKEFRQAIGEGVLKMLFETVCKISVKVQVMPTFSKR